MKIIKCENVFFQMNWLDNSTNFHSLPSLGVILYYELNIRWREAEKKTEKTDFFVLCTIEHRTSSKMHRFLWEFCQHAVSARKTKKSIFFPPSMANDLSFGTNVTVRFCFTRLTNCVSSAHIESIVWIQLHRWEYVLCPGKTFAFHIYAFDENRKNGKCPLIRFIGIHSKKLSSSHPIEMKAMAVLVQCSWRRNAFEAMRKKENKHVMAAIFILKRGYCVWRAYERERCRRRYIHIVFGAAHHLFCYELAETMWTSARK